MKSILTREIADQAIGLIGPFIMNAMAIGMVKQKDLHIIILDPASLTEPKILTSKSYGDPEKWEYPYSQIALSKANICFKNKCSTADMLVKKPFAYCSGDAPFVGGVYMDGLIVACSGVEGYFDQMFAEMIASVCKALCTHQIESVILPSDCNFIGEGGGTK